MVRGVTVVTGPARSGKTSRLLAQYRGVLAAGRAAATPLFGPALWISPTHRAASAIYEQLLDAGLPGCFSPNCLTFGQFSGRLLAGADSRMRRLSPTLVRATIGRLIESAAKNNELQYFAAIAHRDGFLDLVVQWIEELKRLEIWPEELAQAQGRSAGDKDRELERLYAAYQQLLNQHELYDAQGQFWAARSRLREGRWGAFDSVRHVFVDGFTDFTRTEHEILELWAARAESLTISLPVDDQQERAALFLKTTSTLDELRRRHPRLAVEQLARRPAAFAALDHVERHLFRNPRVVPAAEDGRGIEVIAAAGITHEIELLADRIKGLLSGRDPQAGGPVAPQDILVVFRSLTESAELVRELFAEYGIPAAIASRPTLDRAPLVAALLAWLKLDLDDWPFRQVLALLAHNYFQPAWPEWRGGRARIATEQLVRQLELPNGRAALVAGAGRLAGREAQPGEPVRSVRRREQARLAADLLGKMAETLDALPRQATCGQWSDALSQLVESIGLLTAADAAPATAETDHLAWQRLRQALAEAERLSRWIGEEPPQLSRRELYDRLREIVKSEPLGTTLDETGCVRVLSADSARNLSAPYVFVAGLSEKAFPSPHRDDCLYSDAETRRLISRGLPLVAHADRSRYELLLFYEVVTRATRRLTLSYPALDSAAQPLVPSPYLSEVERVIGPQQLKRTAHVNLSSVPAGDDVRSPRDFRVRATANALAGDVELLGSFCATPATHRTAESLLAALATSQARGRFQQPYGVFEGMLASDAVRQRLRDRFGEERCWSPSQLEQYAYCPFRFFLSQVLKVEALSEPTLGIDYLARGRMLHWLLSTVHRRLNELAGGPTSPQAHGEEPFKQLVGELMAQLVANGRGGNGLESGLLEIDARQITAWIDDYYRQHGDYDRQWAALGEPPRPAHFEVAFGPQRPDDPDALEQPLPEDSDPLSTLNPFQIDCGGEVIRFAGRIDRIDLGRVGRQPVFSIMDYKSGRVSDRTRLKAVLEGQSLQLPLYALAAEWLLSQHEVKAFRAAYWHIAGDGYKEKEAVKFLVDAGTRMVKSAEWRALEARLPERVRALVSGIRGGQFPMHSADERCTSWCPFGTACRVNQARSLDKDWQPPSGAAE